MDRRMTLGAFVLTLALACAPKGEVKPTPTGSLYDRLGGKNAIEAVIGQFVENIKGDGRINAKFANADLAGLKGKLVDQVCSAAGGPCTYTGKDMKTAHQGMGITDAEFSALVEDLVKALDQFKVGEKEKSELLGALGPMKKDIVEAPAN